MSDRPKYNVFFDVLQNCVRLCVPGDEKLKIAVLDHGLPNGSRLRSFLMPYNKMRKTRSVYVKHIFVCVCVCLNLWCPCFWGLSLHNFLKINFLVFDLQKSCKDDNRILVHSPYTVSLLVNILSYCAMFVTLMNQY